MLKRPSLDCREYCQPTGDSSIFGVDLGLPVNYIKLSRAFNLELGIAAVEVPTAGKSNFLDIVGEDGFSLLAAYITPDAFISVYYNGTEVSSNQLALVQDYLNAWTDFAVIVGTQAITLSTSTTDQIVIPLSQTVDTTLQLYRIFVSNGAEPSAYGVIENFVISGEKCKFIFSYNSESS